MADPQTLTFNAPLDPTGKKDTGTKQITILVFVAGGILIALTHLYFAAVIVIIAGIVFVLETGDRRRSVKLKPDGLEIGATHYQYKDFKSFWIYIGKKPVLFLQPSGVYIVPKTLVITDYDPIEVRDYLRHHLPEEIHPSERWTAAINELFN